MDFVLQSSLPTHSPPNLIFSIPTKPNTYTETTIRQDEVLRCRHLHSRHGIRRRHQPARFRRLQRLRLQRRLHPPQQPMLVSAPA